MLKQFLLFGAVAVSAPALAQTQNAGQTTSGQAEIPAATADPQTAPIAQSATPADPAGAAPAATPDQMTKATDPAQPAATADQVAHAVDQGFLTYDKNADGTLDEAEFAAWMSELRTASDPSVEPGSPEMKTWTGQAFAAADTDKNAMLSKGEITVFLSQGAS